MQLLLFFSPNTSTYNAYSTVFPAAELAARLLPWVFVGLFFVAVAAAALFCEKRKKRVRKKEASNDVLRFKVPKVPKSDSLLCRASRMLSY